MSGFDRRLTRRRVLGTAAALAGTAGLSVFAISCGGDEDSRAGAESPTAGADSPTATTAGAENTIVPTVADGGSRRGGVLRVALTGDPPNLDIHQTTDSIVVLVCSHIYETLFTWDAEYRPVPLLAASHEVLDDGLRHRVVLQENVEFHNGEILSAADVIASVERWSTISGLGEGLMEAVESIEQVDELTIDFHMLERYGSFRTALSRQLQGCSIYPASVLANSSRTELAEYVGTGPYRFVEWLPDRHVQMERFANYRPTESDADGYAGAKAAYFDSIEFVPVRSEASRIAGMQANDFHFVETISSDQAPVLQDASGVAVDILPADAWVNIVLNLRSPLFADLNIRRAIQIALDHEQIMLAAVGEDYYELTPELVPGAPAWYSEAGIEYFNQNDPEEAKRLLEEAGYDGTPVRMMVTQEVQQEYNATLTMKQQLEDVGFVVDLQVYDGATLSDRRDDEAVWETYTASASFRPDPVMRNLSSLRHRLVGKRREGQTSSPSFKPRRIMTSDSRSGNRSSSCSMRTYSSQDR
ncbi:MAG: ABC transporter substrate-binding protein [Thermomicrobiales bacterium]